MSPMVRVPHDALWPNIVDSLAKEQPEEIYGLWPVATDSYDDGFRAITYGQLANIVNGLAWWIVGQLGLGAAQEGDVLTYIGLNDVRLTAMILASVKTGYTLFPTSPRNSPAAQKFLFETLKCRILVTTDPTLPSVLPILDVVKPRCLTVPTIDELLTEHPPFVYEKPFDAGRWNPLVIWHSSGSTGLPKPIVFTQDAAMRHYTCARQDIPPHGEIPTYQDASSVEHLVAGKRMMVTVPPFHGAGILMYMLWAIPAGCIPIAPAAVGIVTGHGLVVAEHRELGGALVVGTMRFQAALLIEPADWKKPLTTSEQAALIEKVWPTVKQANCVVPAHARIEKPLILVVDRPMIRSGKGTIQRAASIEQYSAEIEAVYAAADATVDGEGLPDEGWNPTDAAAVSRLIRDSVCSVADLGRHHFGMDDETYEQLRARPGLVIIHNAWPVNFNLRLPAFKPQLDGLVNLLGLAAEASPADTTRPASFVFISSVSAVGTAGDDSSGQPAPERVLRMGDAPQTNGYARSKFLSELLCNVAAGELRIPITVARVGQVAGAVQGAGCGQWNRNEWLPSLILGSVSMGCLPEDLGTQFSEIDWLPLLPMTTSKGQNLPRCVHLGEERVT
ncbi:hypothetical protein KVR01_004327 [Diaporthe batatas]|uniref:uncharacterized protein n=1 Tax=Diaporthe batatas TaxID=748121 RepID=UPI001D03E0DF|nr:uncharacterized protein KVR01_004327 [Diaporthe batatas]KAG8165775.1 hypothetical protein KVR01_004327 [Diaporthe batatas]